MIKIKCMGGDGFMSGIKCIPFRNDTQKDIFEKTNPFKLKKKKGEINLIERKPITIPKNVIVQNVA